MKLQDLCRERALESVRGEAVSQFAHWTDSENPDPSARRCGGFDMRSQSRYDIPTAVTFLMWGLGIGSILAILLSRRSNNPTHIPLRASQPAFR